MKNLGILLLSVLLLGTLATSCNEDDSEGLVGKWQFKTMEGSFGSQTIAPGTKESLWSDPTCTKNLSYLKFNEGTGLEYGYYSSADCELAPTFGRYSIDSKKTTLTVVTLMGDYFYYPIVKFTDNELSWREKGSARDENGNTVKIDIVHNMTKK